MKRKQRRAGASRELEAEVLAGLAPFAVEELEKLPGVTLHEHHTADAVRFTYRGDLTRLERLRTVAAVYLVLHFDVPRPKALLGHEHFTRLVASINTVKREPEAHFTGFRFGAAGSGSAVFGRLAAALERALSLPYDAEAGDLLLRIRPAGRGWEVLVRLGPRPLSARAWRACNRAGGLNATLAAAMVDFVGAGPEDRFLNAMCGSGTLLIERRAAGRAARLVGVDLDADALACAEANVRESGFKGIELSQGDATGLDFPAGSFDVILADLPWGDAVGTHSVNASLYPAFLTEMARVGTPGARCAVLTHEIKLFERVLKGQKAWALVNSLRVAHSGHHPRMYGLERL